MFWKPRTISKLAITPPAPSDGRGGLAICLIVRNEARHIAEWARFHHHAGAAHFVVYDNGCTDATIPTIRATLPDGALTVVPWDQKLRDARSGAEIHNQVLAYAHCLRNFGGALRWMAFIDVDEFIVPVVQDDIVAALPDAAHVSLPWHMFGRNGHATPPDGGVVQSYLHRAVDPLGDPHALNWKCIVDPTRVTGVRVHGFDIDGVAQGVNDVGMAARHADRARPAFYSRAALQLNHYYTRSDAELQAKMTRGSNKTVEERKHRTRVMRIVNAIEAETVEDRVAADYLARTSGPAT